MTMKIFSLLILLFFCREAHALDGFETVQCGSDIPKALLGKRLSNERVVVLESRHQALGLKDLGASEISDRLTSISWLICGNEFMLLLDARSIVRDVLAFPSHSKTSPAFTGTCKAKGQELPEVIVSVLDNQAGLDNNAGTGTLLSAKAAWKIDEKTAKFVKFSTEDLRCPRSGVFTVDGGP